MARDGQLGTDGSGVYSYLSPMSPVSPSPGEGDSGDRSDSSESDDPVQDELDYYRSRFEGAEA